MSLVKIRLYGENVTDYRSIAGIDPSHDYPFSEYIREQLPAHDDMLFPSMSILKESVRRSFTRTQATNQAKFPAAECRFTNYWSGLRHEVLGYVGTPHNDTQSVRRTVFLSHLLIQPANPDIIAPEATAEPDAQIHNEAVMQLYDRETHVWSVAARILETWDKEQSVTYDAARLGLPDLNSTQGTINSRITHFFNQLVRSSLEVVRDQAVA